MNRLYNLVTFTALCLATLFGTSQTCSAQDVATQAYEILEKNCYECHGVDDNFDGLDVLQRDILVNSRGANKTPFVTAGNPAESKVYTAILNGLMPPDAPLSKPDQDIIRRWIEGGAVFPEVSRNERPFVSQKMTLQAILNDVHSKVSNPEKPYTRYFSLTHLHNNPGVTEKQLRYTRAALSKAINSMSRQAAIVIPRVVDAENTIYAVNIQKLGWDDTKKGWGDVLAAYPYGVKPKVGSDGVAYDMHASIVSQIGGVFMDESIPIRADWFVVAATRPPLYHLLADIPETLSELEEQLGISMEQNFLRGHLNRGAVLRSGVSAQNRLVDRHDARSGAFWISYDFGSNSSFSNVARFPLGPKFKAKPSDHRTSDPQKSDHPYENAAFVEDGSEVIWELKNGMHGYMIANREGKRIDRAPVHIVWNKAMKGGDNPEVVNGVSCMQCHRKGMRDFTDMLRTGNAVDDEAARFLLDIVPTAEEMRTKYLQPDSERYMRKLTEVIGPFLRVGNDANADIDGFAEPIAEVVKQFERPLTVTTAACELGVEEVNRLKYANLRQLGLGVFENDNGVIQRTFWAPPVDRRGSAEEIKRNLAVTSIFERVVGKMDLGTPIKN